MKGTITLKPNYSTLTTSFDPYWDVTIPGTVTGGGGSGNILTILEILLSRTTISNLHTSLIFDYKMFLKSLNLDKSSPPRPKNIPKR